MPAQTVPDRQEPLAIGVLALVILLYSALIIQRLLLGVITVAIIVGGYFIVRLSQRLVRALERIAAALEDRADDGAGDDAIDGGATGWGGTETDESS